MPGPELTLPIFPHLLEKCKLLGVIHHHELLQQPLDHLAHRGGAADVQLLDGIQGQVEGGSLVCHLCQVHLLEGIVDGLGPDPGRHRHRAPQLQVHLDEPCVRPIVVLGQSTRGSASRQLFQPLFSTTRGWGVTAGAAPALGVPACLINHGEKYPVILGQSLVIFSW